MEGLIVLFLTCVVLMLTLHELGHAFAMRRHGVEMREICLLGFGPLLASFRLPFFGETPVTIRLFPLGAYVSMTDEGQARLRSLRYSARAEVYGSGVAVNLALASVLAGVAVYVVLLEDGTLFASDTLIAFGVFAGIGAGILMVRRFLSAWIFPILALGIIAIIAWALMTLPPTQALGGPITAYTMSTDVIANAVAVSKESETPHLISFVFMWSALVSLSIGLGNLCPFYPFDGGHLVDNSLRSLMGDARYVRLETPLKVALSLPGLALVFLIIFSDIWNLVM